MGNRYAFAANSMPPPKPLVFGDVEIGDCLVSVNGLKAYATGHGLNKYIVNITDGLAFESKHQKEIQYDPLSKRYEIYGPHLIKWHRTGERVEHPSGDIVQSGDENFDSF